MNAFGAFVLKELLRLESEQVRLGVLANPVYYLICLVQVICHAFVRFLTIHPYVDGNGHVARALLNLALFRFGFVAKGWPIDPRPAFPEYPEMIAHHRRGQRDYLEQFVLSCLYRTVPAPP
jgi:Fic/DOC family